MGHNITRDEIDFDWAYVQMRCLEDVGMSSLIEDMYPELTGSHDFLDEFNLVQDHRSLQALAGLADDIEASILQAGGGVNLEMQTAATEQLLRDYLQHKLEKMRILLEEVSKDDEADILIDADMQLHDNELMQMLPLFYDFTLASTDSGFFKDRVSRDVAFKAFGRVLKTTGSKLAKLKDDYKTLLEQQHCFLAMAPFDADFQQAAERFAAGENAYLTPMDLMPDTPEEAPADMQDRAEIRLIRASIINRVKFEEGAQMVIDRDQAETLIALGKAVYADTADADDADADAAGTSTGDPASADTASQSDGTGHVAGDRSAGDGSASAHADGRRAAQTPQSVGNTGTPPIFILVMVILLVLAGWAATRG